MRCSVFVSVASLAFASCGEGTERAAREQRPRPGAGSVESVVGPDGQRPLLVRAAAYDASGKLLRVAEALTSTTFDRAASTVLVYGRGFEARRVAWPVTDWPIVLVPVLKLTKVQLQGTGPRRLSAGAFIGASADERGPAIVDWIEKSIGTNEVWEFALPSESTGAITCIQDKSEDALLWPQYQDIQPGDSTAVTVEPLRTVVLEAPAGSTLSEGEVFLNFAASSDLSAPRLDGVMHWMPSTPFTLSGLPAKSASVKLPAVAFHLFARTGDLSLYASIDATTHRVVIASPSLLGGATVMVRLAGAPPRRGARLLPGRLDLATAALISTRAGKPVVGLGLEFDGMDWKGTIQRVETLTVLDPDRGIAWVQPSVRDPAYLRGDWCGGAILLRAADGQRLTGRVAVWPSLRGTGKVSKGMMNGPLERDVKDVPFVRISGLPAGVYSVELLEGATRTSPGGEALAFRDQIDVLDTEVVREIR